MFYRYELYSLRLMFYRYELYSLRLMFYRYELYSLLVSSQCKCTSAPSDPGFSRDGSPGHTNGTMPFFFFYTLNVSLGLQHQSGQLQCTPPWVWPFNYWYESFTHIIVAHLSDWQLFHYRHRSAVRRGERVLLLSLLLFQHSRLQKQTSVACGNEHCYSCRKVKLTGFFCPRRVTCVWRWRTFHSARLDRDSVPPVAQQSTDGVSVGFIAWQERQHNANKGNNRNEADTTAHTGERDREDKFNL